ncbi:hypothetical protein Tco_1213589 [Tanacetum coccineum]
MKEVIMRIADPHTSPAFVDFVAHKVFHTGHLESGVDWDAVGGRTEFFTSLMNWKSENIWRAKGSEEWSGAGCYPLLSKFIIRLNSFTGPNRYPVVTSLIHIESRKSPTKSLFDADSSRISIFIVNTYSITRMLAIFYKDIGVGILLPTACELDEVQQEGTSSSVESNISTNPSDKITETDPLKGFRKHVEAIILKLCPHPHYLSNNLADNATYSALLDFAVQASVNAVSSKLEILLGYQRQVTDLWGDERDMVHEHIGLKILSWKKVDSEARDKLWDEITRYFDVDLTVRKLVMNRLGQLLRNFKRKLRQTYILPNQNTLSKLNEVPAKYSAILKAEEWVNFVKYTATEEYKVKSAAAKMARSKSVYQHTMGRGGYALVKEKMKETEDKIKEGTLKVDHGTDAMTFVLGKEKGGYARGVGSGVTYKRYFYLLQSRQASDERILLLQSQLDNERRERQEKELLIQNLSNKMSQTEGMVTTLKNQLAAQGGQFQSMSTQLTPPNVSPMDINPINSSAYEEGETIVVGCENDASIQKSNGLARKGNRNKGLPKDYYKVSIDTSLVDATCIPNVGNNGFETVKDAVVFDTRGFCFLQPTPPSTIQMNVENKTAPKLHTKSKNVYVSSDEMQRQAKKKSLQKSFNY